MTRGLLNMLCPHSDLVGEPDENGDVICARCGSLVTVRLTIAGFMRAAETVRRDHGSAGRHSMRCVDTPEGWVCATDCQMGRR